MTGELIRYICRNPTTFTSHGEFDDAAYRDHLERFVTARLGIYVASSGTGAGSSLEWEELRRVYESAVAVGKGKITVGANIPEQFTSKMSLAHAELAASCGVDIVNIYGPDGRHAFNPTDDEYRSYFDRILEQLRCPIALCPLPAIGYTPKAVTIARVCNKHAQVASIVLTGHFDDTYFINLKDELRRPVDIFVTEPGSLNPLALGAAGLAGNLAAVIPNTYRSYLDLFAARDVEGAALVYADIRRLIQHIDAWKCTSPRWHQAFITAFKLPGHAGKLPDPYSNFESAESERFANSLIGMNLPEINEQARAAGLL